VAKLGSWFLLLIISYTLVSLVNAPQEMAVGSGEAAPEPQREAA
jgi:uncharacterized membrane protein YoaT (DUF817 family)